MPYIICLCNTLINIGRIPSPNIKYMFPDTILDKLVDEITRIASNGEDVDTKITELILHHVKDIYECPTCGRLITFEKPDGPAKFYILEKTTT